MRQASRRMLLCLGAGALLAGCLSPTLPLPPPSRPDVKQVGQGQYELRGTLPMPGTVYVQNERTTLVFGEKVEEFYRFLVQAEPGDEMGLWYEASETTDFYGDRSQTIRFQIPDAVTAPPADAGADGGP